MIAVREYLDEFGRNAFASWFRSLDTPAALKVTVALERMATGHTSAMKPVGLGVSEYRIDSGPGIRIYFGWDGTTLILLLGGGTKRRQQKDIAKAQQHWSAYKFWKENESDGDNERLS